MDSGTLLLLLGTQLEVLAAAQVLHLEARALFALHLERDLLCHLHTHTQTHTSARNITFCATGLAYGTWRDNVVRRP